MPRTVQPVYSLALSDASQRGSSFLLQCECSTSVSVFFMASKKMFWDQKNPKKKSQSLSPAQKKMAMARAKKAGRKYPNLVDNAWAVKQ